MAQSLNLGSVRNFTLPFPLKKELEVVTGARRVAKIYVVEYF